MPTSHRQPVDAAAQRKRELARIHALRAKVGMAEDEYRDLMGTLYDGVRSAADLSAQQRRAFAKHLDLLLNASTQRAAWGPKQLLAWSLWQQLGDAGLTRDRGGVALNAWIARQTAVDRIEWLNAAQTASVVEALKMWLKRGREPIKQAGPPHG